MASYLLEGRVACVRARAAGDFHFELQTLSQEKWSLGWGAIFHPTEVLTLNAVEIDTPTVTKHFCSNYIFDRR